MTNRQQSVPTKDASTPRGRLSAVLRLMVANATELQNEFAGHEQAEAIAQAAACAAPILAQTMTLSPAVNWLRGQLMPWERLALARAEVLSTQYAVRNASSHKVGWALPTTAHLFDRFLHQASKTTRKRRGVFFTPAQVADYIVHQIHQRLHSDFPGLTPLYIDPACGTGVFFLAVIEHVYRSRGRRPWNDVAADLLARLVGIEILPAAAFLTKLNIALKLAETAFDFSAPCKLQIITADALAPQTQSQIPNPKSQIVPVILGNPPFASLSTTTNHWIAGLVRGDDQVRGYIRANGQSLGERKTWLHDDYVKFIRLAQWHVENAGCGIVGYVTNHGFLDNATFRLMRHELLRVFEHIEILDLHGNRKKQEFPPDGSRDENIFGLDQGVAISLFSRGVGHRPAYTPTRSASEGNPSSRREYASLWGTRASKLQALANSYLASGVHKPAEAQHILNPQAPDWLFIPSRKPIHSEYTSAWSLADAMPVNTTAPVTARDHFVVAFTREELERRIKEFRDLSIPDDEIRNRYFQRTRSARYQTGDTRSWKLAAARRRVAADDHWRERIIRCLYRPFDWRYVFWHPAMIDWPRTEVTRHLVDTGNSDRETERRRDQQTLCPSVSPSPCLALIARRQQLPSHPCTFFWISDGLALDGVIRSDNRGSESLFPLYVLQENVWSANLAPSFVSQFAAATRLAWVPVGRGDLVKNFGPEDVLAYIYALFHCPTYRERFANALRTAFPRILPPRETFQFTQMVRCGETLIALHLLRDAHNVSSTHYSVPSTQYLVPCTQSFRAGGYYALKKWLQPKHRSPEDPEYHRIAEAIARTYQIMPTIDEAFKRYRPSAES